MSCENRTLGASLSDDVRPAIAPEGRLPPDDEGASPPVLSTIAILLSELHSEIDRVLYEPQWRIVVSSSLQGAVGSRLSQDRQ